MSATETGVREVRLALVCYGGVSLAIYMHGIAKEIQKLVVASTAYEHDQVINPFPVESTEHHWWTALDRAAQQSGVRTRVVVDIVSGTSAGGINGVCLAKAISTNRSQDGLTSIWLDKGDLDLLVRGPKWLPVSLRALGFAGDVIVRPKRAKAPLHGDEMCRWLLEAFNDMDAGPKALDGVETLVPDGQSLDLFVPITDFYGRPRQVPIDSPLWTSDRSFRHVMSFRHDAFRRQFDESHNAALGFASRATSSFPGGFPAINIADFEEAAGGETPLEGQLPEFFPEYELDDLDTRDTWFVDGGVLDNAPFGLSIDAIPSKPAETEVMRRLLYVEPDPAAAPAAQKLGDVPSWPATVWGGLAGIPRQEPIVDDLIRLGRRNQDVRRVRDVIETSFETVKGKVRALVGAKGKLPSTLTAQKVDELLLRACEESAEQTGFGYATYTRLRVRNVVDGFAGLLSSAANFPKGSAHAAFVADVLREWAVADGLLEQQVTVTGKQEVFLRNFDLAYYERQLRFAIHALSWWYGDPQGPSRQSLDEGKRVLYRRISDLNDIIRKLPACPSVGSVLNTVFDSDSIRAAFDKQVPIKEIEVAHAQTLDHVQEEVDALLVRELKPLLMNIHADVIALTEDWPAGIREDFLVRYIGFPFWDVLTFPVQSLSGVNERDGVNVLRLSPRDVHLLTPPDARKPKLDGVTFHHFGAFFERKSRENDYLWGRLDAVERLAALLLDDPGQPGVTPADPEVAAPIFAAVLTEERPRLKKVNSLFESLTARVNELQSVRSPELV